MSRIFISYRRADSAAYAGRLYDHLSARFSEDLVFMDIDTIEPGEDFVEVLETAVASSVALVAVIGSDWLTISNERGERRLDDPNDFVRIEIATALSRNIRVIPVLVDGATMPAADELPDDLKPLRRRNALTITNERFRSDVGRLIEALERIIQPPPPPIPAPKVEPELPSYLSVGEMSPAEYARRQLELLASQSVELEPETSVEEVDPAEYARRQLELLANQPNTLETDPREYARRQLEQFAKHGYRALQPPVTAFWRPVLLIAFGFGLAGILAFNDLLIERNNAITPAFLLFPKCNCCGNSMDRYALSLRSCLFKNIRSIYICCLESNTSSMGFWCSFIPDCSVCYDFFSLSCCCDFAGD